MINSDTVLPVVNCIVWVERITRWPIATGCAGWTIATC